MWNLSVLIKLGYMQRTKRTFSQSLQPELVEVHGAKAEEKVEFHQNEQPRQIQLESREYYALAD